MQEISLLGMQLETLNMGYFLCLTSPLPPETKFLLFPQKTSVFLVIIHSFSLSKSTTFVTCCNVFMTSLELLNMLSDSM